jgi:hypothetical protein
MALKALMAQVQRTKTSTASSHAFPAGRGDATSREATVCTFSVLSQEGREVFWLNPYGA